MRSAQLLGAFPLLSMLVGFNYDGTTNCLRLIYSLLPPFTFLIKEKGAWERGSEELLTIGIARINGVKSYRVISHDGMAKMALLVA